MLRKIAIWAVWNIPLGSLAPHVLAYGLNARFKKVEDAEELEKANETDKK